MIWVTNILVRSYDNADFQKILTKRYRNFVANSSQIYDQVTTETLLAVLGPIYDKVTIVTTNLRRVKVTEWTFVDLFAIYLLYVVIDVTFT